MTPTRPVPAQVTLLLNSPACLRGRAYARHEAAKEALPGSDDYRINMQRAAELEQAAERASEEIPA